VVSIYNLEDIGKRFKEIRGALRQADIANEFEVDRSYISSIEQGRAKPSLEYLMFISAKFNVSVDWILTGQPGTKELPSFIPDEELRPYFEKINKLLDAESEDEQQHMRGWIIIQLQKAFPEIAEEVKKEGEKEVTSENS
jgi:transcriptional regulator with XRE-family HTH domain